MKKLLIIVLMLTGTLSFAQNKNAKATTEVDGVCGMCKARIEKACLNTKGVKFATWDVKTHQLSLIFDERKTSLKTIEASVLAAGHDVKESKATDEAYASVHACCKYRDDDVKDAHQEGEEHKKGDGHNH
ncbi:heavy-metal-associated domain-containing protein [Seonamhaeicola maritimus]|uniref:Heavy-metal-associated domain-containing protein n=1 Tax=Seonamhaeicola maritimus TaxID=2591822 RepID=A0A5C7GGC8_9FLAO|nr:heavy-metal-associated domain-containing protein [Seonamhaeicola maritimus]TXG36562.1 heavy-metal-associated domain-containing protein [Seonamhaeicola maritimus]